MSGATKDRIVGAGAELFRRQGYNGTGVKQIAAEAAAPFGSLYHFFPGGKEQLGEEVIRVSGAAYGQMANLFFGPGVPLDSAIVAFFDGAAETLRQTDFADACPIATIALEVASTNEVLRKATADVFEAWIDSLTERFVKAGIAPEAAMELAVAMLSMLEGAFIIARATRDAGHMESSGRIMARAVRAALP